MSSQKLPKIPMSMVKSSRKGAFLSHRYTKSTGVKIRPLIERAKLRESMKNLNFKKIMHSYRNRN